MLTRFFNMSLRGITLISKLAMILSMARFLPAYQVGTYGLLYAAISYSIYVLGLDFYTYSTREIAARPRSDWVVLMRDQGVFTVAIYFLIFPSLLSIFYFNLLPWDLAPWFFILLTFEHISQEINRLLIATSKPLAASVVLFLRSGLWSVLVSFLLWIFPDYRDLSFIFWFWLSGVLFASVTGFYILSKLDSGYPLQDVSFKWIWKGIKISIPLLVGTLAVRGLFSFDRFFVENFAGVDVLAAYVLFAIVANSIAAFIDSGVVVFFYPKIISAGNSGRVCQLFLLMKNLSLQVVLMGLALSSVAVLFCHLIVGILDNYIYSENLYLAKWLVICMFIFSLSLVPNLMLYALHMDRVIITSQVIGLLIFVVGGFAVRHHGAEGILLVLTGSCLVTGIFQSFYCLRFYFNNRLK